MSDAAPLPIAWRDIPGKGRGVVALQDFAAGAEIERSPVLLMPKSQIDDTLLDEYVFDWSEDEYAVALGLLMVYNHSDAPNAKLAYDYAAATAFMTALRPIKRSEEITWDYGIPLWFDAAI